MLQANRKLAKLVNTYLRIAETLYIKGFLASNTYLNTYLITYLNTYLKTYPDCYLNTYLTTNDSPNC